VIEREGKRDKKNNVKVDVDFYKIEKDEKISLNSEARRSTNEIIRDYLGSYEDFILTSVALQGNQGSLIDMGQSERKELLSQFIGLNVFESLSAAAGVKLRELSGAVKLFNKEVNNSKLESLKNESSLLELKLNDLSSQRDGYTEKKKLVEINIETEQSNIIKLGDVPTSIDTINSERKLLVTKKAQSHESVRLLETEIFVKKQEYDDMLEKNKNFSTDLKEKVDAYSELVAKKQKLEQQMDKLKFVVKEKLKKIDHLTNHQYDPNCKYCCNNSFVKDAMSAKDSLEVDKKEATELNSLISELKAKISDLEPCVEEYKSKTELQNKINLLSATISKKDLEKVHATGVFEKCELRIKELDKQVELFEKSKEIIENNKVITGKINALKSQLNDIATKLKGINTEHVNAYARRTSVLDQIKSIEEQILKIESYENDIAAYQYYMESVGKDGIPYKIIADAVPRIEQLVNNILSQIVEFTIGIETDGKNVNVSIIYDDKKWPLELSSGMERFISALALRVSLINISNLPRANFLLVDEGFGALDASNMAMVYSLFDYLKSNFDFIIVISHLDAMRDMVNKQLEIKKENGFSKIDNTV
jgi:DNA repair exonuclease SbcCD ATPase subunit